jgi:hypothetical protein
MPSWSRVVEMITFVDRRWRLVIPAGRDDIGENAAAVFAGALQQAVLPLLLAVGASE